jgi:hypothetical protein
LAWDFGGFSKGEKMTQKARIFMAIGILVLLAVIVLGIEMLRRQESVALTSSGEPALTPGSIPIYVNGKLVGGFTPADLGPLPKASFVDPAEGKAQEGWLLRDVLLLYIKADQLKPDTLITVSSVSRSKSAQVTWAEADNPANQVMFDLSNRGTLKLASVLEKLDSRDEWVQDVEKIEVAAP